MKILMVCPDYKPNLGGVAELAYCLAIQLRDLGNDIRVLAPPVAEHVPEDDDLPGSIDRRLQRWGFRSLATPAGWVKWPGAMRTLTESVQQVDAEFRPDLCFVTSYMPWINRAVMILDRPAALFFHGEEVTRAGRGNPMSRRLFLKTCEHAQWVFFNSEFSRCQIAGFAPGVMDKSEAVGCGVRANVQRTTEDRQASRQALGWEDGPVLLTVSRLVMRKGIDVVIRAMPGILKRHATCRYVVVGDGPDRTRLENIVKEVGVDDHVVMTGRVDEPTKQNLYAASDAYVMVSYPGERGEVEGFGISFLEANLHGLPVIGSRCGGISESVEHEGTGLLVDVHRPDQVADAADRLLSHPEQCRQMAERGRARIHDRFNWRAIAERVANRLADLHID
jgi:phosphatidylinositol alpha-1,6-mannosyltransferase